MSTIFKKTSLPGVMLCHPEMYGDDRGFFTETYQQARYTDAGIDAVFVQDNISRSVKGTVRGLHYQLEKPQAKLVSVLQGEVLDVAVDIRKGSPHFGQWHACRLDDKSRHQVFIPPGFAHGFLVLSESADFYYKCSDFYASEDQYGLQWNDPDLGIDWGEKNPLLSAKDEKLPRLRDIPQTHLPTYHSGR